MVINNKGNVYFAIVGYAGMMVLVNVDQTLHEFLNLGNKEAWYTMKPHKLTYYGIITVDRFRKRFFDTSILYVFYGYLVFTPLYFKYLRRALGNAIPATWEL